MSKTQNQLKNLLWFILSFKYVNAIYNGIDSQDFEGNTVIGN